MALPPIGQTTTPLLNNGTENALTKKLESARVGAEPTNNFVVPDNLKKKAESALASFPSTVNPGPQEQGHANPPSAAEQAYASAMKKYETALEKYESDLAGHNTANAQNTAIDKANEPHEKKAEFWDKMRESLLKVCTHSIAGDSYISRQELTDLLASSDPGQRSAAEFILANWDQTGAPKYGAWGGGMNANEMRQAAVRAGAEATGNRNLKQPHVTVPPHPGAPPTPPPPPPTQTGPVPTTQPNPSTGSPTQSPNPASQTPPVSGSSPLTGTSSGMAGLGQGIDNIQTEIDGLIQQMKDDPSRANEIQARITKLTNQVQSLTALMNQIFTMQSNLSKMLSEMAMTAIRNMR